MTSSRPDGQSSRPIYTGPVTEGPGVSADAGPLATGMAAAGLRGRQLLELLTGAVRGVAAALRVSGLAGVFAAIVMTAIAASAFDMRWWKALILLVVLALPALEVGVHRLALLRVWGDAERLEHRARTVSGDVVGAAGDFAQRMAALHPGSGSTARAGIGSVRSAMGLRDIAAAVPGLTGMLLLPLRRQVLILTAACTALCWVLLVIGVPVTAVVGIVAAVAR